MTDLDALRIAILTHPDDDHARLVWADALEESAVPAPCDWCGGSGEDRPPAPVDTPRGRMVYQGPPGPCPKCKGAGGVSDGRRDRAEFVRVQVELAPLGNACGCDYQFVEDGDRILIECRGCELRRRERALVVAHGRDWLRADLGPVGDHVHVANIGRMYARGFLAHLTLSAADWFAVGDALSWRPTDTEPCRRLGCHEGHILLIGDDPNALLPPRRRRKCDRCDGTGFTPRPCPDTAQPIAKVTLTTPLPEWTRLADGSRAGGLWYDEAAGCHRFERWKGVAFELPPDSGGLRVSRTLAGLAGGFDPPPVT